MENCIIRCFEKLREMMKKTRKRKRTGQVLRVSWPNQISFKNICYWVGWRAWDHCSIQWVNNFGNDFLKYLQHYLPTLSVCIWDWSSYFSLSSVCFRGNLFFPQKIWIFHLRYILPSFQSWQTWLATLLNMQNAWWWLAINLLK